MKKCWSMPSALLWNEVLTLILLLSALHRTVLARAGSDSDSDAASSLKAYFTNPASNSNSQAIPTYELGSIQNITWTTNLDDYNISIWQRAPGNLTGVGSRGNGGSESISVSIQGGIIFAQSTATVRVNTFTWAVQTYSLDLTLSSIFYLSIEGDAPSASGDFNITTTPPSSSLWPNSSTTVSPIPNPASTETASSLTSTGKIALGLGVGVGAPLITLLAILAYFQYRSGSRAYMHTESQSQLYSHPPSGLGLGLGLGGMGYPSPSAPAPAPAPAMDRLALPRTIPLLYSNPGLNSVQNPSELSPKGTRPIQVHPWEIDANPRSYSPAPPASPPPPLPLGLHEASVSAGNGNGHGNGRSRPSTNNHSSSNTRSASTPTSTFSLPSAISMSRSRRVGTEVESGTRDIPELPGESYNFI